MNNTLKNELRKSLAPMVNVYNVLAIKRCEYKIIYNTYSVRDLNIECEISDITSEIIKLHSSINKIADICDMYVKETVYTVNTYMFEYEEEIYSGKLEYTSLDIEELDYD